MAAAGNSCRQTTASNVPFAFTFFPAGQLDLVNAAGTLAPSQVNEDGTVTAVGSPVADGQVAACWIAVAKHFAYVANTGSNDVSAYGIDDNGAVRLINAAAASVRMMRFMRPPRGHPPLVAFWERC